MRSVFRKEISENIGTYANQLFESARGKSNFVENTKFVILI